MRALIDTVVPGAGDEGDEAGVDDAAVVGTEEEPVLAADGLSVSARI